MDTEREAKDEQRDHQTSPVAPPRGPMARRGVRPTVWAAFHATRTGRAARMTIFVAILLGGGSWLAYARTSAQLGGDLLAAGDGLLRFADPAREEGPRVFRVNGETIHATTGSSERGVAEMLDWYEGMCLERDAGLTEQVRAIAEANPNDHRSERVLRFSPVIRREVGAEAGVVACLDLGEDRRSPPEILQAAQRFRETRDLHELGDVRYLYARRTASGRTQFISVWTEGAFNVDNALPSEGDAPGEDLATVPRAPGSRRVLSAYEEGRDERYYRYDGSTMTAWELEAFFTRELGANGWDVVADLDGEGSEHASVLAMRDGRQLYVLLDTDVHGRGSASVMLTE